jgi:hypothetical protein
MDAQTSTPLTVSEAYAECQCCFDLRQQENPCFVLNEAQKKAIEFMRRHSKTNMGLVMTAIRT